MKIAPLTHKQQAIVELIPRFRFIDRTHIQTFLNHKQKQRINKWLKDLMLKKYLKRFYDNTIVGPNRKSAIFTLANNGVRFVKAQGIYDDTFIHTLYWDKVRSDSFIEHCLLIAKICCELEQKCSDTIFYEYSTTNEFGNSNDPFHFLSSHVTTDLYYSKKENGKKKQWYLLEFFDERFPKYRLRYRMRRYIDFYYSNTWENNTNVSFPKLLFVCETLELMIYSKRYIKTLLEENNAEKLTILFATSHDAKAIGVTGAIWEGI